jgi:hypothetical protein
VRRNKKKHEPNLRKELAGQSHQQPMSGEATTLHSCDGGLVGNATTSLTRSFVLVPIVLVEVVVACRPMETRPVVDRVVWKLGENPTSVERVRDSPSRHNGNMQQIKTKNGQGQGGEVRRTVSNTHFGVPAQKHTQVSLITTPWSFFNSFFSVWLFLFHSRTLSLKASTLPTHPPVVPVEVVQCQKRGIKLMVH